MVDWESIDKRMDRLEYENHFLMKKLNDVLQIVDRIVLSAKAFEDFLQNLIYNTRAMWMSKRGLSER